MRCRCLFALVGVFVAASAAPAYVEVPHSLGQCVRESTTIALVDRPGVASPPPPSGWSFVRVDIPRLDVSSTEIRRRIGAGEPVDGLVPPGVRSVIEALGLYR